MDDIAFPKHLGIEVDSKKELVRLVEESVKNDSGVRVPMKEVESRMKNRFKLAKTIAKASARS
ncbi:hypothetical protein IKF03_02900 [Candidatus Saccharibacteria bacterium]|nr:hypothetical protein [Candidatus Saccharibacteria bacterium]